MSNRKEHFNRREWSGAFGDIGTDLPLITGMLLVADLSPGAVLGVFGLAQIASALFYGIPMPVQPLKAVAALVIAGGIAAPQIYGAGLSIGIAMLLLTATGLLEKMRTLVPRPVIRGLQIGLGIKLAQLSLLRFIPDEGLAGIALAGVCGLIILLLRKNHRCPSAIPVIGIGLLYMLATHAGIFRVSASLSPSLPALVRFTHIDMLQGFLLLALPQIPLSLGNSLFATHQMASDLFPQKGVRLRTIGYTYSLLNIISAPIGGIPVCHGTGGMAGHYFFGGRTGGSVLIYGTFLILLGIFWGNGFGQIVQAFPLPVLGTILLAESGMLLHIAREGFTVRSAARSALPTALIAAFLPYGFLIGMIAGTILARYAERRYVRGSDPTGANPVGGEFTPPNPKESP
jgi:hypothetical protein